MGLADLRCLREGQLDCDLSDEDQVAARLASLQEAACAELMSQGITDPRLEITAHLRYEGSHQSLGVSYGTQQQMAEDFEAAHKARFGFASPDRKLQYEMLSVEAIGEMTHAATPPQGFGAGVPIGESRLYRKTWHKTEVYDRGRLREDQVISGPAIIIEPTGTNVVEPGWQALWPAPRQIRSCWRSCQTASCLLLTKWAPHWPTQVGR